ncbi:hypothetical protein EDB83DRAFT_2316307 [Lactarius deliciosus]|nr:hypothetical protein EDB83DRAFT_2316307 [Lactarius deliciosus]
MSDNLSLFGHTTARNGEPRPTRNSQVDTRPSTRHRKLQTVVPMGKQIAVGDYDQQQLGTEVTYAAACHSRQESKELRIMARRIIHARREIPFKMYGNVLVPLVFPGGCLRKRLSWEESFPSPERHIVGATFRTSSPGARPHHGVPRNNQSIVPRIIMVGSVPTFSKHVMILPGVSILKFDRSGFRMLGVELQNERSQEDLATPVLGHLTSFIEARDLSIVTTSSRITSKYGRNLHHEPQFGSTDTVIFPSLRAFSDSA